MKLPNCELARVSESKIAGYLLSPGHPHGRHKAAFFARLGFSARGWQGLAEAIVLHAMRNDVMKVEDSPFGKRYVIEGLLRGPGGRARKVRSVWFIESGGQVPQFVTAYPIEK